MERWRRRRRSRQSQELLPRIRLVRQGRIDVCCFNGFGNPWPLVNSVFLFGFYDPGLVTPAWTVEPRYLGLNGINTLWSGGKWRNSCSKLLLGKTFNFDINFAPKVATIIHCQVQYRYHNHKYINTHNTARFMIRILLINHNKGWNMIMLSHSLPWNSFHYCNDWVLTLTGGAVLWP